MPSDLTLTHTHTTQTDTHTLTQDIASGCTYRYKLPVPFGGRLVSKRQEGMGFGGKDTNRKSSRQVMGQIQRQGIRLSPVTMETDLMLKTTGKG